MSYTIVTEMWDMIPPEASPTQRLIALIVADLARDDTRSWAISMDELVAKTGCHADTVRRAISGLAKLGLDLRSESAHKGRTTVYRIPKPGRKILSIAPQSPDESAALYDPKAGSFVSKARIFSTQSQDLSAPPSPYTDIPVHQPREESAMTKSTSPADALTMLLAEKFPNLTQDQAETFIRKNHAQTHPDEIQNMLAFCRVKKPDEWTRLQAKAAGLLNQKPSRPPCVCDQTMTWLELEPGDMLRKCRHTPEDVAAHYLTKNGYRALRAVAN